MTRLAASPVSACAMVTLAFAFLGCQTNAPTSIAMDQDAFAIADVRFAAMREVDERLAAMQENDVALVYYDTVDQRKVVMIEEDDAPLVIGPTSNIVRLKVVCGAQSYVAGIAPNLDSTTGVTITVDFDKWEADGPFDDEDLPFVNVQNGFAIVRGNWVIATTNTVGGGTSGTSMVIQHDAADSMDRAFLIEKVPNSTQRITVVDMADWAHTQTVNSDDYFVKYDAAEPDNLSDPIDADDNTPDRLFIDYVKFVADACGLPK